MEPSIKMPFTAWTPDTASIYNEGEATVQNCLPYLQAPNYAQSPGLFLTATGNINGTSYLVNAVKFNGTSNYLLNASNLTGIANGQAGSLSLWVRIDSLASGWPILEIINAAGTGITFRVDFNLQVSNNFTIQGLNPSGTRILYMQTTANYSAGTTWLNILASWNLATGATNLYVNNVADNTTNTATNDTLNYAPASSKGCQVGANIIPQTFFMNGGLAELWFNTGFIDFSNSANRAKFISSSFPVNLGSTGQTPTGSSPLLYLKSGASTCGTNSGTGGNFTQNGTFSIASSSPSDQTPTQYSGGITCIDSGDSPHTYVGTTNKLAEITASTANNVSKAAGYTNVTFWKFAQFNNNVYATDFADNIQSMTVGGTAFADLGGSPPKAKAIAQAGQFLMLGNTNGGTSGGITQGAFPNRTWWSNIGAPASWTDPLTNAGIAAQTGINDLPEIYGAVQHITNGQLFVLVFQEHAISNYYYVGGNVVWQINTFEKQRGLYCPNGAVQVGDLIYFIDQSGFFITDGSSVQPIGHDQVDNTWLSDVNTAYLDHVRGSHDAPNKCIWWTYVSTQASLVGGFVVCDKVIVYNYADKRWGLGYTGQTIDIIFDAKSLGYTMEQLDAVNSNLDLITPSLDSPYWNGGNPIVGAFGIGLISGSTYASYYATFNGAALTATLTTKTVNANQGGRALMTACKPIVTGATPSNITVFVGTQVLPTDAVTYTSGSAPETRTGKCSMRADGVFHNVKMQIAGGFTNALGVEPEFTPSGQA